MHKKKLMVVLVALVVLIASAIPQAAEEKGEPSKYEYAIIKWDGPDRMYYNLPGKFELVHLKTQGVGVPTNAEGEEWYLTHAANQMAKDGWEAINLDSRRIFFRRAKK